MVGNGADAVDLGADDVVQSGNSLRNSLGIGQLGSPLPKLMVHVRGGGRGIGIDSQSIQIAERNDDFGTLDPDLAMAFEIIHKLLVRAVVAVHDGKLVDDGGFYGHRVLQSPPSGIEA